jgi:hypothetical protein
MLNTIFNGVKHFFRFLIEKPGANIDWKWSVDMPYGNYDGFITNNQSNLPARESQGFGAKDWAPAQINYYVDSQTENNPNHASGDVWTPEKLIKMSGAFAQAYGVPLQNEIDTDRKNHNHN